MVNVFWGQNRMSQPNDSSVEEILESIKKVIARDNREDAVENRRQRATQGVPTRKPASSDADNHASTEKTSAPTPEEEVLDLAEMEFVEDIDQAIHQPADTVSDEPSDEIADDNETLNSENDVPLTNDSTRNSMRENLEALAMLSQPSVPPQIVRSGETSLEGLVREMLRPMLAEWLDDNLPDMVEAMVQAEIAQIARKGK